MFIDTHAHLYDEQFKDDFAAIVITEHFAY
jgi:Tat protein secretion system quality control protein TatD with DNase activity